MSRHLTDEQRAIVEAEVTHTLITAVAGSGKTSTLALRICYLLENGVDPHRILVLMYNRAAKQDFETKLRSVAGQRFPSLPEVRTYHSMGFRLYKRFIAEGALTQFQGNILSEQEIHFQLWQAIRRWAPKAIQDELKRNKKDFVELASTLLDLSKTTLDPIEVTFEALGYADKYRFLLKVVAKFEEWRKQHFRISYADMLYEPVLAISQDNRLEKLVANKMDVLLVDEYQDTNEIQHLLLQYIAGERAKVTVVGDPDQTIYEFRGAQPEYILRHFSADFPDPATYTLSHTFRYGHRVALLANHLISHNSGRTDVLCKSHPSTPETAARIVGCHNENRYLLQDLYERQAQGVAWADIAILIRLWSQSVSLELALLAAKVPYHIDQGKGALANKEVLQCLAVLELASGRLTEHTQREREVIFHRLLHFPHIGVREELLRELSHGLARLDNHWGDYLLDWIPDNLHPFQKRKLRRTAETWQQMPRVRLDSAGILRHYIDETDLFKGLADLALTHDKADERIDNVLGVEAYLKALQLPAVATLEHFQALEQQARALPEGSGLTLATIHRSKGLEWDYVFIPGLNAQRLPYQARSNENLTTHTEAERRLLYVAMTRAKRGLTLYHPGQTKTRSCLGEPSPFIAELQGALTEEVASFLYQTSLPPDGSQTPPPFTTRMPVSRICRRYLESQGHSIEPSVPAMAQAPEDTKHQPLSIAKGARVDHVVFGPGIVIGEGGDVFDIQFDDGETRRFSKKSIHLYLRTDEQLH